MYMYVYSASDPRDKLRVEAANIQTGFTWLWVAYATRKAEKGKGNFTFPHSF